MDQYTQYNQIKLVNEDSKKKVPHLYINYDSMNKFDSIQYKDSIENLLPTTSSSMFDTGEGFFEYTKESEQYDTHYMIIGVYSETPTRVRIITIGNDNTTSQYQTSEQAQFYTTIEMKTILSSFDRSKYNYSFRMFNVDQLILHSSYEPLENKEITNNYIINVNQFNIDTFQIGQLDNLFHSKIILIRLNLDSIQFIM